MFKNTHFLYLAMLALALSLCGFFMDGDPRAPSIMTNLTDIGAMTLLFFVLLSLVYTIAFLLWKGVRRLI